MTLQTDCARIILNHLPFLQNIHNYSANERGNSVCRRLCRDVSVCGKVLAVIVLPSLPLILCNCRLLSSSPEDRRSTRGSRPRPLHYLWPVVKLTPLLLWSTSSLPPHSQANYQRYHLFERDAAQMERMRVAREPGEPVKVEKRWLRMREGANVGSGHGAEQKNSVNEGANEKESRAQGTLGATDRRFMSFFCATHQFLL